MKRTLLALSAVGCLTLVAVPRVSAQGLRWGVNVGMLMPMGDYNTFDKTGWVVGGGGTYWLTGGTLGVRGDVAYSSTQHDGGAGETKIIGGMASLVYGFGPMNAPMRPFLNGGVGFFSIDGGAGSSTKVGFGIGGGLSFKAGTGGMRVVVATRYTSVSSNGSTFTFLPITVGLTFGK
ncbi:MAG TPA: hypothetical protein VGQ18_08815 [Gemmatimonadales bacterium]|jgi:hypothetical protein|nr:hypothetical protein [Gemmatimonadales bacterium]